MTNILGLNLILVNKSPFKWKFTTLNDGNDGEKEVYVI